MAPSNSKWAARGFFLLIRSINLSQESFIEIVWKESELDRIDVFPYYIHFPDLPYLRLVARGRRLMLCDARTFGSRLRRVSRVTMPPIIRNHLDILGGLRWLDR